MQEEQEALHFLDYWRVIRSRKEIIIAVTLLVVLTGILVTYSMPKVYRASCIIGVQQEAPDVELWSRTATGYDPFYMRTMFEIIQSRPIIEETIRKSGLDRKLAGSYGWSKGEAFDKTVKLLSRGMKVQQYRDTNLIEIQIYLAEPKATAHEEAARAANMVADVFRDQRILVSREETERGLRALKASLDDQMEKVDKLKNTVKEIRELYGINVGVRASGANRATEEDGIRTLDVYRRRTSVELAEKEARLKQIEALSGEQLLETTSLFADVVLASLVATKQKYDVELSRLLESYGDRHPKVLEVKEVLQGLDTKIKEKIAGLKTSIRIDYESTKAKLGIIVAEMDDLKKIERQRAGKDYQAFDEAVQEVQHAQKLRVSLEARYLQERIELRMPRTIVEKIQPARPSDDPVSPDIPLNIILSIIVGLGSGIALAYFVEYLDTSVKTVEDVEKYMGVPVLGVIPQKVKPLSDEDADAAHAEAYRILRTNLRFSKRTPDGRIFSVTSGSAGEGKSLTLFNMAFVSAKLGEKVLVVDADLHRPTQHKIMGVDRDAGLANVLVGEKTIDEVTMDTGFPNLTVIPSGRLTSGHHGLLDTLRMKEVVEELRGQYDLVLFDGPPITGVSDAALLAREMDGVILVIQHRKHPKAVSNRAKAMVENVGGLIAGVVLNNINISRDYSYYYYGHYYSYAYTKTPKRRGSQEGRK